jgi:hypothetical protein
VSPQACINGLAQAPAIGQQLLLLGLQINELHELTHSGGCATLLQLIAT